MKQFLFSAFAFVGFAIFIAAIPSTSRATDVEVTGTWKVKTSFDGRTGRVSILTLEMDNGKLTGSILSSQDRLTPLLNVRYEDREISFEVTRQWNGREYTTPYSGKIDGDIIQGTAEFRRRDTTGTLQWEATRTTSADLTRDLRAPPVTADIDLNEENYEAWRDYILPRDDELEWQQIPWLTTFKDGILAANATGKPLLFWTMNGHPLGCT